MGAAEDIGHEALVISSELLEFAPLPGLRVAAIALLDIWEALQMVDVSAHSLQYDRRLMLSAG